MVGFHGSGFCVGSVGLKYGSSGQTDDITTTTNSLYSFISRELNGRIASFVAVGLLWK